MCQTKIFKSTNSICFSPKYSQTVLPLLFLKWLRTPNSIQSKNDQTWMACQVHHNLNQNSALPSSMLVCVSLLYIMHASQKWSKKGEKVANEEKNPQSSSFLTLDEIVIISSWYFLIISSITWRKFHKNGANLLMDGQPKNIMCTLTAISGAKALSVSEYGLVRLQSHQELC